MKILLLGDKESTYIWDYFDHERFKGVDFVISSGDLKREYLSFVVTMLNVPLFFVPGNHDKNYVELEPEGCINIDRTIVNHNGFKIMGLGGSQWYNDGVYQYTEKQMYYDYLKLKPKILFNKGIDMLVTHSPALGLNDGNDRCHKGFKTFVKIIDKYEPAYHIHGHEHLNYGLHKRIIKRNSTFIINSYEYYLFDTSNPEKMI